MHVNFSTYSLLQQNIFHKNEERNKKVQTMLSARALGGSSLLAVIKLIKKLPCHLSKPHQQDRSISFQNAYRTRTLIKQRIQKCHHIAAE